MSSPPGAPVRFRGYLQLPLRLPVNAELLGTADTVDVGGLELRLAWPRRAGRPFALGPPLPADDDFPWQRLLEADDPVDWGHWQSDDLVYVGGAAVHQLAVDPGDGFPDLAGRLESWFAVGWDRIAAWSGCAARASERVFAGIRTVGAEPGADRLLTYTSRRGVSVTSH